MHCMLNVCAAVLFFLLNAMAHWLCCQPPEMARRVVRRLCALLLGGNLLRYLVIFPVFDRIIRIPAEFSTLAYFLVPLIVLCNWRQLRGWAAYSALLVGFCYYMAMIFAGQALYGSETPENVCISLLCHGCLYFCGYVMISTEHAPSCQGGLLLAGVGCVALRAAVLRPLVAGRSRMLIYILLDAVPVRVLFPETLWPVMIPVFYVLVALFLVGSIAVFYRRSETQYRRFAALRAA